MSTRGSIRIVGAEENNLAGLSLDIPKGGLTVITGPSGAGKRSLVFDTLVRESRWRLAQLGIGEAASAVRPRVERISGLSWVLVLGESRARRLADYVGLGDLLIGFFELCGERSCPTCGAPIAGLMWDELDRVCAGVPEEVLVQILLTPRERGISKVREWLKGGFAWGRVGSVQKRLEEVKFVADDDSIQLLVDSVTGSRSRLRESLLLAKSVASEGDTVTLEVGDGTTVVFSTSRRCDVCGREIAAEEQLLLFGGRKVEDLLAATAEELHRWLAQEDLCNPILLEEISRGVEVLVAYGFGEVVLATELRERSERIRAELAGFHLSAVRGVVLVGDHLTAGMHADERLTLVRTLRECVVRGDTVIAIDSDPELLRAADVVVAMEGGDIERHAKISAESAQGRANERRVISLRPIPRLLALGRGRTLESLVAFELPARIVDLSGEGEVRPRERAAIEAFGILPALRDLYSLLPDAKVQGLTPSDFTLRRNACERCRGEGFIGIGSQRTVCSLCQGRRFSPEILRVLFRGMSLGDLLGRPLADIRKHFLRVHRVWRPLDYAVRCGVGHVVAAHPMGRLGADERQRLLFASLAVRKSREETLFVLESPTTHQTPSERDVFLSFLRSITAERHVVVLLDETPEVVESVDYSIV